MVTTLATREELIGMREPGHTVKVEPCAKWVRAMHNGQFVADSKRTLLLFETGHLPVYYFPREDVRMDLMSSSDTVTQCGYKGNAEYYTLNVGGEVAEDVMWGYPDPLDDCPDISNYVAFYWNKIEHWFEEDEEVFVHARDPRKRIDCLPSSRHVRVEQNGVTLAESQPPDTAVRDQPAGAVLPARDGRAHGPAGPQRKDHTVPVQGPGELLLGAGHRGWRRPRLVLPATHVGVDQDRQPGLLLQRACGRVRGRRAAGAPDDALVAKVVVRA